MRSLLVLMSLTVASACIDQSPYQPISSGLENLHVTYNGNGNTGGTVPTDPTDYVQGQTVTVQGNSGNLVETGNTFIGWNTLENGSGASFNGGQTFTMGTANVTLYAQWTTLPTFTVTYDGNSNTGGAVPASPSNYLQGQTVTVLGNSGSLFETGSSFSGWNTQANGSGVSYTGGQTLIMGSADVTLYAQWTGLSTYIVTYDGNGNSGGLAPTDTTKYTQGQTVTTPGNGSLSRTGYNFAGWTTNPLSTGPSATYTVTAQWAMGSANVTLYAVWIPSNLTFTTTATAITLNGYNTAPTGVLAISPGVTSIGYAFPGCSGLTSVTIPSSVTSIGSSAFFGCSSLTSVAIPASVTSIGSSAFCGCTKLTSISVDSSNPNYSSSSGVLFDKAQATLHSVPAGMTGTSYTVPSTVTSIGSSAFYGCSKLTSVTIPSSVTSIGSSAFSGCSGLTSVAIPASVTSIGSSAFYGCTKLTSISVDSLNSNYWSDGQALFDKAAATLIAVPPGMTGSYTVPSTVTSIGSGAFSFCSGLTSITIASSVTSIGSTAFNGCSGLTSVTIPSSVASIGSYAFYYCSSLASVTMEALTPPSLQASSNAFLAEASGFKIHVPDSSAQTTYQSATGAAIGWLDYSSEIVYP